MSALKFIQLVARKKAAQKGGEGITTIGNRMNAEAKAGEIAETFRLSGLTPDKWDQFIKSEKDVLKYLNIIESTNKQAIKQSTEAASKGILKTTKKKEKPFTGWTPKVVEKSMPADDYYTLKEEWFGRIIANTDDAINTWLKKGIDAADERFVGLSKSQRKDFLDMVQYRLKHGNRKFMDDSQMFFKEPKAYGGIAGMLGEPTYQDEDHRIPFKLGGIDKARRLFLQAMGAGAATVGAAKSGLFGLLKGSKSAAVKDLTQVPIQNAEGMPSWFKPLVNRVIKEGKEITKLAPNKGGAYLERQIVHSKKLGEGQEVRVYQNLDDQSINVEYKSADNMGGVDDGIVNLEYRAPQDIYDTGPASVMSKEYQATKKASGQYPTKSKPEFEAHEAYPLQDPKDYKTITFESDNTVSNVDDLFSDTSALKQFGTNKALTKKELKIAKQKRQQVKKINEDPSEELAGSGPDYDDYASGGRVPFVGGGWAFKLATKYRQSKQYKNYIEKLFVKTSNDIRRGEGLFKNLSSNEKIKLHDDLTKEVTNYQKTGELPKSAHQYFGFNPEQKYADKLLQKQLKMTGDENLDYDWVETPEGWVKKPGSEGAFYRFGKENKELIDKGIKNITAADELRREFPGITDDLVNKILTDTNKQRIAEVKATMKEALKMQEKGMGTDEIIQTFKTTPRTKNADGGVAGMLGE